MKLAVIVQFPASEQAEKCGHSDHLRCVPDPGKVTHRAWGLKRLFLPRWSALRELMRRQREATRSGFAQSWRRSFASESDWLLVPGAALVERGGRVLWLHRGEHPGDLPSAEDLLAVAQEHVVPAEGRSRSS